MARPRTGSSKMPLISLPLEIENIIMTQRSIPKSIETKVLTQSKRRCCLCFGLHNDMSEKAGQIAHLDGNPSNNRFENLAFLCLKHHDEYDGSTSQSKGYTIQEAKEYRTRLYDYFCEDINTTAQTGTLSTKGAYDNRQKEYPLFVLLPIELKIALRRFLPEYRLPDDEDLTDDWLFEAKPDPQSTIYCKGYFTGSETEEYCFFAISEREDYKILVLSEDNLGNPHLIELRHSEDSPARYYVKTVKPGNYSISPVIWKRGGKKTLKLEKEAIEVGMFESASCIFYWSEQEGKFMEQWIVD